MSDEITLGGRRALRVIQTHTSRVFLFADEVLKVKKGVRFSFLDYSTVEARRAMCEKECALNRRFAPQVYLGTVPLGRAPDGSLTPVEEGAEAVEWAVRMGRLPEDGILSDRLARGDVRPADMEALAEILARFYASAARGGEVDRFGLLAQVRENTEENFATTADFPEDLLPDALRRFLAAANARFLAVRRALFEERVRAGRIVDGHGDLKPENIFLTAQGPVVTDCIEFNDRFRYGDALSDVAYLTMGLLAAGRPDLRAAFLARFRAVGERDLPEDLLRYYEVYRAVVKGKIEGYRARQQEVPEAEREQARGIARAHFGLARDIVLGFRPVRVTVWGGPEAWRRSVTAALARGLAGSDAGHAVTGSAESGASTAGSVDLRFGAEGVARRVTAAGEEDARETAGRAAVALADLAGGA